MTRPSDAELAAWGREVDVRECGPCGGACCKVGWTVLALPPDLERLERATGRDRREFATVAPLPEWERAEFGEANLLWPRVLAADGRVPQLAKREDGSCVFLDERGACGVHDAKPVMCRLFPFYYDTPPHREGERASPLGTRRGGRIPVRLLVDRGHAGFCPVTEARLAEIELGGADALARLMVAFEEQVREYGPARDDFVAAWP